MDYDWDLPTNWSYVEAGGSDFVLYLDVPLNFTQVQIALRAENGCGESAWFYKDFFPNPNNCSGASASQSSIYSFSPNPANDELTISKNDSGDPADTSDKSEIVIHDSFMNKVYQLITSDDVIKIPVGNFPEGMYFLEIANKKGVIRERILISR